MPNSHTSEPLDLEPIKSAIAENGYWPDGCSECGLDHYAAALVIEVEVWREIAWGLDILVESDRGTGPSQGHDEALSQLYRCEMDKRRREALSRG